MKKPNVTPVGDRLLVLPDSPDKQTASGIIIPDSAQEKNNTGVIIVKGQGLEDKPWPAEMDEGRRIMYSKLAGVDVKLDGVEYKVLRQTDVMIIMNE